MGTFVAGRNITQQILRIITLNGIGVFIAVYSSLFMPPGGDMARITMAQSMDESAIEERLLAPNSGLSVGTKLNVETFYATNAAWDTGRAFEIWRKNPDSLDLKDRIDKLTTELQSILAKKSNAEAAAERAAIAGNSGDRNEALAAVERYAVEAEPLETEIAGLEARQKASADAFLEQLQAVLGPDMMESGSQVIDAGTEAAILFEIPLTDRPDSGDLRRTLDQLRLIRPDLIDLRLMNRGLEFYLEASLLGTSADDAFVNRFIRDFHSIAESRMGDSLPDVIEPSTPRAVDAVSLKLLTIEDPINNHISPITKVIYAIWDWVGDPPTPERRIWATARGLREPGKTPHVGIWDQSEGSAHAILIRAIPDPGFEPVAPDADAAASDAEARISSLLGPGHPLLANTAELYRRSIDATAANRMTIPEPVLDTRFAPPKYDYMSGYLFMIAMSTIGLGICLLFTRRERKGLIHKRGRQESEAEEQAEMALEAADPGQGERKMETYRPGYVPHKILMVLGGLTMVAFGMVEMGPHLKLLITGESATALASKVVKERIGASATELATDADILEAKERFDRTYVFWNYFRFKTGTGDIVEFRADTGKQLEPAYPIRDPNGLPTTVLVRYDPDNPQEAFIPGSFSTWFLSGLLVLFGGLGTFFGAVMLYFARKPIAKPVVLSEESG
jgi:hypothetical protein